MDKNGVVRPSHGPYDVSLVNILDVASLYGESVEDDGEMRDAASILFEFLRTFDCVSLLIGVDTMLQLFNCGPRTGSDSLDVDQMVGLLIGEGSGHVLFPVSLSLQ